MSEQDGVTVYGTEWCHDTTRTREHLDTLGVPYEFVDIDEDPDAREWVVRQNGGREMKPTVLIDGDVLSVPSDRELDEALREHDVLS